MKRFWFEHSFVDAEGGYDAWGASVAADFDGDGIPEYATGGRGGGFFHVYDLEPQSLQWTRHVITHDFNPCVGAAAVDVDGNGCCGLFCGEWGERYFYLVPKGGIDRWEYQEVGRGPRYPHDIVSGDIDGDGREEVIVREKDGVLLVFRPPVKSGGPWNALEIANSLAGDGTCLAPLSGKGLDIVTNQGWFRNVKGDGTVWKWHPLIPKGLQWDRETRIAAGDVDGDGRLEVVITESEIEQARLAVLHPTAANRAWEVEVLLDKAADFKAFHSLQLADLDGDGNLEIFTGEMENGKTDGVTSRPRWLCLARNKSGNWETHVLLDKNLGTHCAVAADFDGDGRIDLVGKVWRANKVNGNSGRNHVDFLHNVG